MPPFRLELNHGNQNLAAWPHFLPQLLPGSEDLVVDAKAWHSELLALPQQKPLEHRGKSLQLKHNWSNQGIINNGLWLPTSDSDKTRVKKLTWWSFHNIYKYWIIMLYPWNKYNTICQLHLNFLKVHLTSLPSCEDSGSNMASRDSDWEGGEVRWWAPKTDKTVRPSQNSGLNESFNSENGFDIFHTFQTFFIN